MPGGWAGVVILRQQNQIVKIHLVIKRRVASNRKQRQSGSRAHKVTAEYSPLRSQDRPRLRIPDRLARIGSRGAADDAVALPRGTARIVARFDKVRDRSRGQRLSNRKRAGAQVKLRVLEVERLQPQVTVLAPQGHQPRR